MGAFSVKPSANGSKVKVQKKLTAIDEVKAQLDLN
jgi:hypothetical protein